MAEEDEVLFRCVYCLKRQKWARTDVWAVDHVVPRTEAPELECSYDNLVLTCQWCNSRKLARGLPDPVAVAYGNCMAVDESSGDIRPLNDDGHILIRVLKLDSPQHVRTRADTLRRLKIMAECAPAEWLKIMSFPGGTARFMRSGGRRNCPISTSDGCALVPRLAELRPNR